MKTLAVVFYCLLVPSFLFAQIQITSNDVANTFAPGKAWQHETSPDTLTMNVGNASGSSQAWTIPANIFSDTTVNINISPANTPYASYFPTATNAQYVYNHDYAGIGTSDTVYGYFRITPDTMWTLGAASHLIGNGLDTVYIGKVNYISAIFPMHYGEKFVAEHDSINYGLGDYQTTTMTVHYDAFGSITFPDGTFNALRQTQTAQTDTYTSGSLSSSTITHDFSWITKAHGAFNAFIDTSSKISGDVTVYQPLLNLVENYPTAVNENTSNIPENYRLFQNYPNPFNPSTTLQYQIPQSALVIIKVYDALGKEVKTLVNQYQNMGSHEVNFNSGNLSSGVYFYTMQAGSFVETKKMILLK